MDLHDAIDAAYDKAIYEQRIYRREPHPTLRPADREWAKGLINRASHGE